MVDQPLEPMLLILQAQAANIARIKSELEVPGTDGSGDLIKLWGPTPEIVRLYDTPLRFVEGNVLEQWQRIVTLMPLSDTEAPGRVIGRTDRAFRYQVQFLVKLLDPEIAMDREQIMVSGQRPLNPLATKAHKLIYDFHHVFADNQLLTSTENPQGLVDHAVYALSWEPGVEYPMAMFTAEIAGTRSAW